MTDTVVRDLNSSWRLDNLYHIVNTELLDWLESLFTFQEINEPDEDKAALSFTIDLFGQCRVFIFQCLNRHSIFI